MKDETYRSARDQKRVYQVHANKNRQFCAEEVIYLRYLLLEFVIKALRPQHSNPISVKYK